MPKSAILDTNCEVRNTFCPDTRAPVTVSDAPRHHHRHRHQRHRHRHHHHHHHHRVMSVKLSSWHPPRHLDTHAHVTGLSTPQRPCNTASGFIFRAVSMIRRFETQSGTQVQGGKKSRVTRDLMSRCM
eukprot:3412787-Rhodomonas_salina.2